MGGAGRALLLPLAAALLACTSEPAADPCPDGFPAGAARPAGCTPGVDWLAYAFTSQAGVTALFIGKPDGSCTQRVTTDTAYAGDPAFFPGGTKLVYASTRSGLNQLYVRDLLTGVEAKLETSYTFAAPTGTATLTAATPAVSPDGATIAFEGGLTSFPGWSDVFTVPAAGGAVSRVTSSSGSAGPKWSHDGALLYFYRAGAVEIFSIQPDGTSEAPVTAGSGISSRFDLSGDGQALVYARNAAAGATPHPTELVALDLASATVRVVSSANEADPAVDAASSSVAVSRRNAASGYDLVLLDYATGALKRQLTSCPGQAYGAAFAR